MQKGTIWSQVPAGIPAVAPQRRFVPPRVHVFVDYLGEKFGDVCRLGKIGTPLRLSTRTVIEGQLRPEADGDLSTRSWPIHPCLWEADPSTSLGGLLPSPMTGMGQGVAAIVTGELM